MVIICIKKETPEMDPAQRILHRGNLIKKALEDA